MSEVPANNTEQDATAASIARLQRSVKRLRVWLIILTIAIAGPPLVVIGGGMLLVAALDAGGPPAPGTSATDIAEAKKEIRGAFGSELESVTVKAVKRRDANASAPFAFMESTFGGKAMYVEYRLKGAKPPVADIIVDEFAEAGATSVTALLPTRGPLSSRLTSAQQRTLMNAFAEQTSGPVGPVARYGVYAFEMGYPEEGPGASSDVTLSGKKYKRDELWQAMVGRTVKGDSITISESATRKSLVFRLDPAKNTFEFVGDEPVKGAPF